MRAASSTHMLPSHNKDRIVETQRRPGEKAPIQGPDARPPASLHGLLFDRYADAVLVTDESGGIVEANLAATTLLGHSRGELLSLSVSHTSSPGVSAVDLGVELRRSSPRAL